MVTIMHHADPDRIGATLPPEAWDTEGSWVDVGRLAPTFVPLHGSPVPLGDPYISRTQLRLRWLEDTQQFQVEPAGRLTVSRVSWGVAVPRLVPLNGVVHVPENTLLALGDRVLLRLHRATPRPVDEDRLGMVGDTEAMWEVRGAIRRAARFHKPVLVSGPTGAGKELVARAIHTQGVRGEGGCLLYTSPSPRDRTRTRMPSSA